MAAGTKIVFIQYLCFLRHVSAIILSTFRQFVPKYTHTHTYIYILEYVVPHVLKCTIFYTQTACKMAKNISQNQSQ
jgi:hypothetical protein